MLQSLWLFTSLSRLGSTLKFVADYRQSLWDYLRAAFPRLTYCLASATLTNSAVDDILSIEYWIYIVHHQVKHRVTYDNKIWSKDPLQVTTESQHLPPGEILALHVQCTYHLIELSQLVPVDSRARVLAGWRPRATLVLCHSHTCWQLPDQHTDLLPDEVWVEQSQWVLGIWKTAKISIFLITGSFFKTAAEDLGLASLQWSSIAVS